MQFLLAEDMSMPFMFPGPNLSAYSSLITVYFIEMLGRRRGGVGAGGKRSLA